MRNTRVSRGVIAKRHGLLIPSPCSISFSSSLFQREGERERREGVPESSREGIQSLLGFLSRAAAMSMAAAARAATRAPGRAAARFVQTRLRSSGKVLSEEEKAAENVYIKVYHPRPRPSSRSGARWFLVDAMRCDPVSSGRFRASWARVPGAIRALVAAPGGFRRSRSRFHVAWFQEEDGVVCTPRWLAI